MSTGFYKILNMTCSGMSLSALRPNLKHRLLQLRLGTLFRRSRVSPLILFVLYQFCDRLGIYGNT
jgi:hypothetical protein